MTMEEKFQIERKNEEKWREKHKGDSGNNTHFFKVCTLIQNTGTSNELLELERRLFKFNN